MSLKIHRIYQFRPDTSPRDLDTLVAKQLYSSTVGGLNDPFEFIALRILDSHPEKKVEYQNFGITCFCRSITNPLLWSHYAASHRGFAIGYDSWHRDFSPGGKHALLFHNVKYEDVPPSLDRYGKNEFHLACMTTKPTCLAYEQEVRLISTEGNKSITVPADMIKEVVFGIRMRPERRKEIMNKVRAAGIKVEFSQMENIPDSFGVKPKLIKR